MICPKCHQNVENSGFCPFCGFDFTKMSTTEETNSNEIKEQIVELKVNNNPFNPSGCIKRLGYFITNLIIVLVFIVSKFMLAFVKYVKKEKIELFANNSSTFIAILCIVFIALLISLLVYIFVNIKRLRDLRWSLSYLIFLFVPYIGILCQLPLFFVKGKDING